MAYTRFGRFKFADVAKHIGKPQHRFYSPVNKQVHFVRLNGQRMQLLGRSQRCVACGIKGTYFHLECSGCFNPHFNLYATGPNGEEVLMTMDHILPRSSGGKTEQSNLQVMCCKCNVKKGSRHLSKTQLKKLGEARRRARIEHQLKKRHEKNRQ